MVLRYYQTEHIQFSLQWKEIRVRYLNVYIVLAMKRSGHHALINWIIKQHGNIKQINNAALGWEHRQFIGPERDHGRNPTDVIINIEDFDIGDWSAYDFPSFPIIRKARKLYPIIFIRDFRNWLASCLKRLDSDIFEHTDVARFLDESYYNDRKDWKPGRITLWNRQLTTAIRSGFPVEPLDPIPVSYNQWFMHPEYRKSLANMLDIPFSDAGIHDVPAYGHGSSFEGVEKDGKADEMDVLSRWKLMEEDEGFKILIEKYKELTDLSDKFFEL